METRIKNSPPQPPIIREDPESEQKLLTDTTTSEEIHPIPAPLLSYYIDSPPFFPDILILLGWTIPIAIGIGTYFASSALIPLSFEGTFWSVVLHTLLFSFLFFSMRVTNFPILFTLSFTGSLLAVIVAHLYTFMTFRSIFLSSAAGLKATAWTCIGTYLVKAPIPSEHILIERHLYDWAILLIESVIMFAGGAIPPFCVFVMHENDDNS